MLRTDAQEFVCQRCGQAYRVQLGIPDLRWPPGVDQASTRSLAAGLMARYPYSSFDQLVDYEIGALRAPARLKNGYLEYRLNAVTRGGHFERMFRRAVDEHFGLPGYGLALDLGCGSGASLPHLARDFRQVWAIDPFLPDLILAQKLCKEHDLRNVRLVQASGQRLPFGDSVFDYVRALNVIEHLLEVEEVFREVARCLVSGGCFCGDSRNRLDPFMPEPHVKLRWVGFWPRSLMPWYVRTFRKADYRGVHLLSLAELRRYLRKVFGAQSKVTLALPSAYGYAARLDRVVARLEVWPIVSKLLYWVFPSYVAVAQAA